MSGEKGEQGEDYVEGEEEVFDGEVEEVSRSVVSVG